MTDVCFHSPPCECGSRQTERIDDTPYRLCHGCGRVGTIRVRSIPRGWEAYVAPKDERGNGAKDGQRATETETTT